jgi:methionyl-tRNA formyltransferase
MFFGTPAIAIPALQALSEEFEVCAVVCQPDRAAGRGLALQAPAVKVEAERLGLEVIQPSKLKDGGLASFIRERHVELALVMAYGRILPLDVLTAPHLGCLNLHASLLPSYRGAAPIQRALMDGKTETGLCLMQMDEGLDTGDVLAERRLAIGPDENHQELSDRLATLAAEMVHIDLPRFVRGELIPQPQDPTRATHAKPLTPADLVLDFMEPATRLKDRIRALAPKPGAAAFIERDSERPRRLRILEARAALGEPMPTEEEVPGQVRVQGQRTLVRAGDGYLEILRAQVEGRTVQAAGDLLRGRALRAGDRLRGSLP